MRALPRHAVGDYPQSLLSLPRATTTGERSAAAGRSLGLTAKAGDKGSIDEYGHLGAEAVVFRVVGAARCDQTDVITPDLSGLESSSSGGERRDRSRTGTARRITPARNVEDRNAQDVVRRIRVHDRAIHVENRDFHHPVA